MRVLVCEYSGRVPRESTETEWWLCRTHGLDPCPECDAGPAIPWTQAVP